MRGGTQHPANPTEKSPITHHLHALRRSLREASGAHRGTRTNLLTQPSTRPGNSRPNITSGSKIKPSALWRKRPLTTNDIYGYREFESNIHKNFTEHLKNIKAELSKFDREIFPVKAESPTD